MICPIIKFGPSPDALWPAHYLINSELFLESEGYVAFWYTILQLIAESSHYLMWLKSLCSWAKARQRWAKARQSTVFFSFNEAVALFGAFSVHGCCYKAATGAIFYRIKNPEYD